MGLKPKQGGLSGGAVEKIIVKAKKLVAKLKVYDSRCFQSAPLTSIIPAQSCLASVMGLEEEYSIWHDGKQLKWV